MGFDNLNYTSEDMDNDSIQDKIDANTLDINDLTKDRLHDLKADIENSNSSLYLRDQNGDKIGIVRDNEELTFLGGTKKGEHGEKMKLFLEVQTANGQRGFVSADYLKGEILPADVINGNTGIISTTTHPEVANDSKVVQLNELKAEIPGKIMTPRNKETKDPVIPKSVSQVTTIPSKKHSTYKIGGLNTYNQGDKFAGLNVGPEVSTQREIVDFNNQMTKIIDVQEKMNNPKINILFTILPIWIDAAQHKADEQWSLGGMIDDKEKIKLGISKIEELFNTLMNTPNITQNQINNFIKNIFTEIYKVEDNEEDVIDNIEDVHSTLMSTNTENIYDNKAYILKKLSGGFFDDGNTRKVLELTRNQIIKDSPEFKAKITKLLDITSFETIKKSDFIALGLDDEDAKDLVSILKKENKEIREENVKQRKHFEKTVELQFSELVGKDKTDKIDDAMNASVFMRLQDVAVNQFINTSINKSSNKDPYTVLYKDLDSFSQSAGEWLGDNMVAIVASLVPMGAAFALVGIGSKIGRAGYTALQASKYSKVQSVGNVIGHTGRIATTGRNFVKGAIFYEGMNTTNNMLYLGAEEGNMLDIFNGWDDGSEILKMGATFGIFGLLQNTLRIIPAGQTLKTIPNRELAIKIGTVLLAEGSAFTAIDFTVEEILEEGRTWEEYLEVFASGVMIGGAFRGLGKLGETLPGIVRESIPNKVKHTVVKEYLYKRPDGSNMYIKEFANGDRLADGSIYKQVGTSNMYKNEGGITYEIKKSQITEVNKRKPYNIDENFVEVKSFIFLDKQESLLKIELKKEFSGDTKNFTIGTGDRAITINKDGNGKFYTGEHSGATPMSLSKIIKEINSTHSNEVLTFLNTKVTSILKNKNPNKELTITWREERITKDGTYQVKDKITKEWKNATKEEIKVILSNPEKVYKILSSKIDTIQMDNAFSKEGRKWIEDNGGYKGLIKNALKSKTNIALNVIFVGSDVLFNKDQDLSSFFATILLTNVAGVVLKSITVLPSGIIEVCLNASAKHRSKVKKFLSENMTNIIVSGAIVGGIIYKFKPESEE